jgi:hypothetical protein
MRFIGRFGTAVLAAIGLCGCASDNPSGSGMGGAVPGGSGGTSTTGTSGMTGLAGSTTGGSSNAGGNPGGGGGDSGSGGGGGSGQAAAGAAGMGGVGTSDGGGIDPHPLVAVLAKFTAPDVPARGPMEAAPNPRNYTGTVPTRPGKGLAQHPMLYVGENYNRILMVNEGKVIWTYDTHGSATAPWELDDIWLLSNGNVLFSHQTYIEEITPTKQVVWHYDTPGTAEIHTCQPIGLDKVLVAMNQDPNPKLMIFNTKTNAIEMEHAMPDGGGLPVHGQVRRMRMTANGTYLVAWIGKGKVIEYDKDFKPIWTYVTPRPWSVARLHNGNTLMQDENESTCKEVDAQGTVVWSLKRSEISIPGAQINGNTQTCERLATGNTVMLNHSTAAGNLQAVEVSKDKQVVWALEDYKNLGDATSAQFLDEPGIPDVPGATEH